MNKTSRGRQDFVRFRIGTPLEKVEQLMIAHTLKATKDDQEQAARLLGISVKTLRRKLSEYRKLRDSTVVDEIKHVITSKLIAEGLIDSVDKRASRTQFLEMGGGVVIELAINDASERLKFESILSKVKAWFPQVEIHSMVKVCKPKSKEPDVSPEESEL